MAEETQTTEEKKPTGATLEKRASKGSLIGWLILFAVVTAGITGGFALSQLIGGHPGAGTDAQPGEDRPDNPEVLLAPPGTENSSWSYDKIEPVVANLDEPGVTRYIRVTVTLEISGQVDRAKMETFLSEKNAVLKDWLTTYFAGLSLEDVRGSRNLARIKREIQERLNEMLFADGRPLISRVLFKEFAVQ